MNDGPEDPYGHEATLWWLDRVAFRGVVRGLAAGTLMLLVFAAPLAYAVTEIMAR